MGNPRCAVCGLNMVKNGTTKAGRTRFRCKRCGSSSVRKIGTSAMDLKCFLGWLLSRKRQSDMPGAGRTFRRRCAPLWEIWPMPPKVEGPRGVVYVDSIHLGRKAVVLIASDDSHALGWHLCRAENSRAWSALMRRIAAPEMVVSDGGRRPSEGTQGDLAPRPSPALRVPRLLTGQARHHLKAAHPGRGGALRSCQGASIHYDAQGGARVGGAFIAWSERWDWFLSEQTKTDDGKYVLTHERLVKARGFLARLISARTLFTYLDPRLEHLAPLPSTNNRIEGGVNSRLRGMLRDHRGLSIERRLKAIFWWCYMHSPSPLPAAGILRVMPTGSSIKAICERLNQSEKLQGAIPQWGDAIVWSELHHSEPWRMDWD